MQNIVHENATRTLQHDKKTCTSVWKKKSKHKVSKQGYVKKNIHSTVILVKYYEKQCYDNKLHHIPFAHRYNHTR